MKALRYGELMDLPTAFVKFDIYDITDLLTISDIDHFFFLKI